MTYKLYRGDCLEVMQGLIDEGVVVDAVICDPPYQTTACHWDKLIPFPEMWQCINGLIKKNGAVVLFGSGLFTAALKMSNTKHYRQHIIWEKTNSVDFAQAKKRLRQIHEDIILFSKAQATYNPQMHVGAAYIDKPRKRTNTIHGSSMPKLGIENKGERYPTTVIKIANPNNGIVHSTQKPIPLMEYLIKTYTNEGDTILDFTCGSGSTICAALNLNRKSIGIERDPHYFQVAKNRIENHPIQRKLF